MGSSEGQTYCLRWNNHKSNLVEILFALIKMECYVDCTIYVDEQVQFKAHRVVLAANSPYFQSILQDVPMDHCSILFPGVQEFEMRALLEYMYTGEVSVTQAQIPRIMKIAEQLEVKGLYDMADLKGGGGGGGAGVGGRFDIDHHQHQLLQNHHHRDPATMLLASNNNYNKAGSGVGHCSSAAASSSSAFQSAPSPGAIATSSTATNVVSQAHSSSSSPPCTTYKSPYSSLYSRSPGAVERDREREERSRDRSASFSHSTTTPTTSSPHAASSSGASAIATTIQQIGGSTASTSSSSAAAAAALAAGWPALGAQIPVTLAQTQLHSMLSSAYDSSTDMNPLKRKKLQSMSSMMRDTPILRNVLAQANPPDSSQPLVGGTPSSAAAVATIQTGSLHLKGSGGGSAGSGVCGSGVPEHPERPSSHHSNGSGYGKLIKEPPHSPYADKSFEDELLESPHGGGGGFGGGVGGADPRLASYVPQHQQQKPEWKRYKQYTRTDILNAIDCVRKGMSALQASRKFGVPSRTLYDKVKKLGITTGRPINRALKRSPSSGGSPAPFPYGLSGTTHHPHSHMFPGGTGGAGGPGDPHHHHHQHQQLPSQSSQQQQQDDDESGTSAVATAAAAAAAAAALAHHEAAGRMIKLEHGSHHGGLPPTIPHPAAALLDPSFLQQALEARGGDIAGREALHAMALAAAAHAAVNGMSTSPGTHGNARSPSPNVLMKYMRSVSMSSPEDAADLHHHGGHHQHHHGHHHHGPHPDEVPGDHGHHHGHPVGDRHHQNGGRRRRDALADELPMEQDSIDETGSEFGGDGGGRASSSAAGGPPGPDDHVEDLSMGPKRDSSEERRGLSLSPVSGGGHVVRRLPSRSPSPAPPPPPPQPAQQGVIVPGPGKLKEDYSLAIKREISIANDSSSNVAGPTSESS